MRARTITALALSALCATALSAAEPSADTYTKYLVPLADTSEVRGANGSVWVTEIRAYNPGARSVLIEGPFCNPLITDPNFFCREQSFVPNKLTTLGFEARTTTGAFLYVPNGVNGALSLRVRDTSRVADSFGTAIPVPRVADFTPAVALTDLPTDARYRATLRIYNSGPAARKLVLRVYAADGRLVEERPVELLKPAVLSGMDIDQYPSYAMLDPYSAAVRASGTRVSLEIYDPSASIVAPPPGVWAFVSITNNETQQVTIVAPNR